MTDSQKLRALADFLDAHPGLPGPNCFENIYAAKEQLILAARIPGAKKVYDASRFNIRVEIENSFYVTFFKERSAVCTPVRYEVEVVPAAPAYERRIIKEWRCDPLLEDLNED